MPAMNLPALVLASVCSLGVARGAPGSSSSFDINADWVSWDDATWTLKSTRPLPGVFTAWLPQSNGYDFSISWLLRTLFPPIVRCKGADNVLAVL